MDAIKTLAIATALLDTFGGRRECACDLASRLTREDVDLAEFFVGLMQESPMAACLDDLNQQEYQRTIG